MLFLYTADLEIGLLLFPEDLPSFEGAVRGSLCQSLYSTLCPLPEQLWFSSEAPVPDFPTDIPFFHTSPKMLSYFWHLQVKARKKLNAIFQLAFLPHIFPGALMRKEKREEIKDLKDWIRILKITPLSITTTWVRLHFYCPSSLICWDMVRKAIPCSAVFITCLYSLDMHYKLGKGLLKAWNNMEGICFLNLIEDLSQLGCCSGYAQKGNKIMSSRMLSNYNHLLNKKSPRRIKNWF